MVKENYGCGKKLVNIQVASMIKFKFIQVMVIGLMAFMVVFMDLHARASTCIAWLTLLPYQIYKI